MKSKYFIRCIIILSCVIIVSLFLNHIGIGKENTLMVFIVGVLLVATFTEGYFYGVFASIMSVLCFNYFFTLPHYDFHMSDSDDIMLMIFFLLASFIACNLTDRFQKQIIISRKQEKMSKQLYILSERLLNISGIDHILKYGSQYIKESISLDVAVSLEIKETNEYIYPIIGMNRRLGTIELLNPTPLTEDQIMIIKASANQIGNALEREMTYLEQEKIKLEMEKEHMMNNMLKSISHDLRTPLTGIVGASQLIMNQNDFNQEDTISLAKDIYDQAKWLTQIVENILNMSKIDSGSLMIHKNLEAVDDLIHEAVSLVNELENRHLTIHTPQKLIFVNVDGKLIVQVLVNLLDNASKYTTPNDHIEIIVDEDEQNVIFMIKDSGAGIHESIADHIFDEFVTYSSVSADSKKGIGLGLAICQAVIDAHGGIIKARNNDDQGACFMFTIPKGEEVEIHE